MSPQYLYTVKLKGQEPIDYYDVITWIIGGAIECKNQKDGEDVGVVRYYPVSSIEYVDRSEVEVEPNYRREVGERVTWDEMAVEGRNEPRTRN